MEKQLISIEEVRQRTGMSKAYAYKLIRRLSDESTPRDSSPFPARSASTTSSRGCSAPRLPREVRPLSVNRDPERETWMLQARHPNAQNERKKTTKRGFKTKQAAKERERDFLAHHNPSLDMPFSEFFKVYEKDVRLRPKLNTRLAKEHIARTKIFPFFGSMKMRDISPPISSSGRTDC